MLVEAFSDIENLTGGTSADTFTLNGGTLSGSITGGAGAAVDTLTADNGVATQFVINGANQGSITGIAGGFTDVENLTGGATADTFRLDGGTLSGTIDGGSGAAGDTLIADDGTATLFVITGLDTGTTTGVAGGFADIENLAGGTSADTFRLDGGTLSGAIDGGGGGAANDNLVADDAVSTSFVLTGANTGATPGIAGGFSDIENLTGGASDDLFVAPSGTSLTGTMTGAAGNDQFAITPDAATTFLVAGGPHSTPSGDVLTVTEQTQLPVDDGTTVTTLGLATVTYSQIETTSLQCGGCAVGSSLSLLNDSSNSPMRQAAFADLGGSPQETNSAPAGLQTSGETSDRGIAEGAFATFATTPAAEADPSEEEDTGSLDQAFLLPSVLPSLTRHSSRRLPDRSGAAERKVSRRGPVAAGSHLRNRLGDLNGPKGLKKDFFAKDLLHRPTDSEGTDPSDPEDRRDEAFRKPRAMKRLFALLNTFFSLGF